MVIDTNVFRALNDGGIKEFLINKEINIESKTEEYRLDSKSRRYWAELLEELVKHGFIKIKEVEEFLSDELNYGRAKHVYIEFIENIKNRNLDTIIERIKLLEEKGYKNASKVNNEYFQEGIREFIDVGDKKLIESKIEVVNKIVTNIRLLFGEGIIIETSKRSNNYYSVDINLEINVLSLRMINWSGKASPINSPDNKFEDILNAIKNVFSIDSFARQNKNQRIAYDLVNDLISKVLKNTITLVNERIEADIMNKVRKWGNNVLGSDKELSNSDKVVITQLILNNFYRVKMSSEHKTLTPTIMKQQYGVHAYSRQVKFFDETAGEGRAKSSDIGESVLDTSVFYDIKARLDKEKNIKSTIIYWMSCGKQKTFGTAIHLENQNRFKLIFYPLRINKEMFDYVLQEIKRYC